MTRICGAFRTGYWRTQLGTQSSDRPEAFARIRFTPARAGRGKSGAYRVGYVQFPELGFILLITVWSKNDKSDLSRTDRNAIATLVQDIRMKLKQRSDG